MNGPKEKASSAVLGADLCGVEDELPAIDPPLPVGGRIEDGHLSAARAGCVVVADERSGYVKLAANSSPCLAVTSSSLNVNGSWAS